MFNLFVEGGAGFMTILTIELILILIAAWKAPAWLKELGGMALATGIFSTLLGLRQMASLIQEFGGDGITLSVICGGIKVALIAVLYALIIYFISLVLRIVRKPRI